MFLDLIKDFVVDGTEGSDGIFKIEDTYVRPALVARFSIGRLFSKYIVGHPRENLENLERCKKYYEQVNIDGRVRIGSPTKCPVNLLLLSLYSKRNLSI